MYLEISARQTGKTTRLVNLAVEQINKGKSVIVVGINLTTVRRIRDLIIPQVVIPLHGSLTITTYSTFKTAVIGRLYDFYLFDEFDFAMAPEVDESFIKPNGYYYTTPRFVRDAKYRRQYNAKRKWNAIGFDLLLELARIKRYDRIDQYFLPKERAEELVKNTGSMVEAYANWNYVIEPPKPPEVKGLKQKYIISKVDGTELDEGAEYFVLRLDKGCEPNHRDACLAALRTYAVEIKPFLPELSADILRKYHFPMVKQSLNKVCLTT